MIRASATTKFVAVLAMFAGEKALAEIILDRSYSGTNYSNNGWAVGETDGRTSSQGIMGTIAGSGTKYVTGVRAPIQPTFPNVADPTKFSLYIRADESGPGAVLGSLVLDSRIYTILPQTELSHVYSFLTPIAVQGGQKYWLTFEPNQVLSTISTLGLSYGFAWPQIAGVELPSDIIGAHASATDYSGGDIPTEWSVLNNRFLAFQLLGVPEPSSLCIAAFALLGLVSTLHRN